MVECVGKEYCSFDDTCYPEQLNVDISISQVWPESDAEKILEVPIEDHVFEVFATEIVYKSCAECGLPLFYIPVVMRVFHTYSLCLEQGGA